MTDLKVEETRSVGRPTKYTDEMPQRLKDHMKNGKSIVQFCAANDISKETFYTWTREHVQFLDAFNKAKNACESYWEEYIAKNIANREVNAGLVKFYMANRFGWTDKQEVKSENKSTIVVEQVTEVQRIREIYRKDI